MVVDAGTPLKHAYLLLYAYLVVISDSAALHVF